MYFILNLSHYINSCGHFCQIFYDARSPNMVISRDPRSKFRKFLFCPNSTFNIRKCHKISSEKALYFRSYQPKTSPGGGGPPVLLGLKGYRNSDPFQNREPAQYLPTRKAVLINDHLLCIILKVIPAVQKKIHKFKIIYIFVLRTYKSLNCVSRYHFKVAYVILQMAVKEFFETHF